MHLSRWLMLGALLSLGAGRVGAQDLGQQDSLGARIWLDRGDEAVLNRGDRVRIYYRTSADAYVAIFHIDTDGAVQLLYPRAPDIDHFTQGNKDYQLLFSRSAFWYVDEYPGTGYYFIVASQEPFDFTDFAYSPYERGWDLSRVGRTVYRDPYLAMDDYVSRLIPDWKTAPYALDFLTYYVGEQEPYPRFLCYNCHEFRSYTDWNPYAYACSTFRVVIWDDPYFSPAYRYSGTRVVFSRAVPGRARFEFKERGPGEPWSPLVRRRTAPQAHTVQFREPAVAPRPTVRLPTTRRPSSVTPAPPERRGGSAAMPGRAGTGTVESPTGRGTTARPSTSPPTVQPGTTSRGGTDARPTQGNPNDGRATPVTPRGTAGQRPVLERRPTTPGRTRPSDQARPTGQGGGRSGGGATVITQPRGSGSTKSGGGGGSGSGSVRPSTPPSRPPVARPPTGGRTRVQPPTRGSGGRPTARPPTRGSGGSGGRARVRTPTRRDGGSGGRPAAARSGGSRSGGSARSRGRVVRRGGGAP